MDSLSTYLLLALSAFFAGAINSIAGGGTLLTFPTLLAVLNPVAANATSTIALVPGALASAWGYRRELHETKALLRILWLPSFAGGVIGALALTRLPERVFENLIPWLLLTASTLLLLQKPLSKWLITHPHAKPTPTTTATIVFFQFLVGIYGGYFGAGIGILMLSALSFMGISNINHMNGLKSILAIAINGITAAIFIYEGVVVWKYAWVMALAAIAGGYVGAHVARRLHASHVRAIVVTIGFAVAAYSFYRRFFAS